MIKRRFLINFRIDPKVLSAVLPSPFKPKLHNGYGIGGICLIRLEQIRPNLLPLPCGLSSENAAHRFAVQWEGGEGVYIPRRDSDSLLNQLAGGSIFPGVHHAAVFKVNETDGRFDFSMQSKDTEVEVAFKGKAAKEFLPDSCFTSLEEASAFFEAGSLGYSDTHTPNHYHGLSLLTESWAVEPFTIEEVYSSYFSNTEKFPAGSIELDHALFMSDIDHKWHQEKDLCCS